MQCSCEFCWRRVNQVCYRVVWDWCSGSAWSFEMRCLWIRETARRTFMYLLHSAIQIGKRGREKGASCSPQRSPRHSSEASQSATLGLVTQSRSSYQTSLHTQTYTYAHTSQSTHFQSYQEFYNIFSFLFICLPLPTTNCLFTVFFCMDQFGVNMDMLNTVTETRLLQTVTLQRVPSLCISVHVWKEKDE